MGRVVNIGDFFGEWEVIGDVENYKVLCRCSCGKERKVNIYTLLSGKSTSCGHTMNRDRVIDLTGEKFGMLTPIKYAGDGKWECRCECGNIVIKHRNHLLDGRATSCGCVHTKLKNLEGMRFGKLTAVKYVGDKQWLCKCDCGNTKIIRSANLVNGSTLSCGCMHFHGTEEDIINAIKEYEDRFGCKPSIYEIADKFGLSRNGMDYHIEKYPHIKNMLYTSYRSKFESDIVGELIKLGIAESDIIHNKKNLVGNYELDIYIPSKRVGIEFNGTYWHSDIHKEQSYHQNKVIAFAKVNIRLISIFEYEWTDVEKRRKIIGLLKSSLTESNKIYYARNLKVCDISNTEAKRFCNENHLQNGIDSTYNIGIKDESGELLGVMTFGKSRFNEDKIELYRMAFKIGTAIVGGAEKMFGYFVSNHPDIQSIVTYCDISKFTGNSYSRLGFKSIKLTKPSYVWVNRREILNRAYTQKHILIKNGLGEESETEEQIMTRLGYVRIWGCGNIKLEWTKDWGNKL